MKKIAVFCTVLVLFLYGACSNAAKAPDLPQKPDTPKEPDTPKSSLRRLTPPSTWGTLGHGMTVTRGCLTTHRIK